MEFIFTNLLFFLSKTLIFSPEFKAFVYILYDNGRDRWQKGGEYLRDHPTENKVPEMPSKEERDKDPTMDLSMWTSKYTSNKNGRTKTGWTVAAFTERGRILEVFQEAMSEDNEPALVAFETAMLPIVRRKYMEDGADSGKSKSKKRKISAVAKKEAPVINIDFSSDEDLDLDEVGDTDEV